MEILLILLAELLTPIVIPAGMGTFALLWCIIELPFMLLEMIFTLIVEGSLDAWKKRRQARAPSKDVLPSVEKCVENKEIKYEETTIPIEATVDSKPAGAVQKKRKRKLIFRIAQWGAVTCVAVLLLLLLSVAVVNAFFFESVLRYSLWNAESRTKISVDFEKASGSLWAGKVKLENVAIRRSKHPTSQFDLKAETIELDLSVTRLLRRSFVFESVHISRLEGTWEQVGKSVQLKPRRKFLIERLNMEEIRFEYIDRTKEKAFQATLALDSLESTPLRSNLAMFDLLFRTRASGSVNRIPFVVDSESGKHSFRMNDVPVELLANYVGTLDWFETGKVDLLIEDKIGDGEIAMHWNLTFHDFKVKAPEGTSLKVRTAAMPLVAFLNLKSKRLPLEFDLQMKENEFQFKSSTELNDVARIVVGDKIMDGLKKIKDRFKKDDDEG